MTVMVMGAMLTTLVTTRPPPLPPVLLVLPTLLRLSWCPVPRQPSKPGLLLLLMMMLLMLLCGGMGRPETPG